MYYTHKTAGGLYEMTNKPDEAGVAQYLNLESNQLCLGKPGDFELTYKQQKIETMKEFARTAREFYTVCVTSNHFDPVSRSRTLSRR